MPKFRKMKRTLRIDPDIPSLGQEGDCVVRVTFAEVLRSCEYAAVQPRGFRESRKDANL
jgi:hypothetical protein